VIRIRRASTTYCTTYIHTILNTPMKFFSCCANLTFRKNIPLPLSATTNRQIQNEKFLVSPSLVFVFSTFCFMPQCPTVYTIHNTGTIYFVSEAETVKERKVKHYCLVVQRISHILILTLTYSEIGVICLFGRTRLSTVSRDTCAVQT
jgi:hypothetical protein